MFKNIDYHFLNQGWLVDYRSNSNNLKRYFDLHQDLLVD